MFQVFRDLLGKNYIEILIYLYILSTYNLTPSQPLQNLGYLKSANANTIPTNQLVAFYWMSEKY